MTDTYEIMERARADYFASYRDYKSTLDKLTVWVVGDPVPFCFTVKQQRLHTAWDAFVAADCIDYDLRRVPMYERQAEVARQTYSHYCPGRGTPTKETV